MKKTVTCCLMLAMVVTATAVLAHHAAEGIVDDDIYLMIEAMVVDTPHATFDFDDMTGDGVDDLVVTAPMLQSLENMIDDGLLTYASMLDGDVEIFITFDDRSVTLVVAQTE